MSFRFAKEWEPNGFQTGVSDNESVLRYPLLVLIFTYIKIYCIIYLGLTNEKRPKMDFKAIRESVALSQAEIAVLFNVALETIERWELDPPELGTVPYTLYGLIEKNNQEELTYMVTNLCGKHFDDLKQAHLLKGLICKVVKDKILAALSEVAILKSNPQWSPEQLGFKVTRISRTKRP